MAVNRQSAAAVAAAAAAAAKARAAQIQQQAAERARLVQQQAAAKSAAQMTKTAQLQNLLRAPVKPTVPAPAPVVQKPVVQPPVVQKPAPGQGMIAQPPAQMPVQTPIQNQPKTQDQINQEMAAYYKSIGFTPPEMSEQDKLAMPMLSGGGIQMGARIAGQPDPYATPTAGAGNWWEDPAKLAAYNNYNDLAKQNYGTVTSGTFDQNNNFVGSTPADTAQYLKNQAVENSRPAWLDNQALLAYQQYQNPGMFMALTEPKSMAAAPMSMAAGPIAPTGY